MSVPIIAIPAPITSFFVIFSLRKSALPRITKRGTLVVITDAADDVVNVNPKNNIPKFNVENIPIDPTIHSVTDMGILLPLKRNYHFCRLGCLIQWMKKEKYIEQEKNNKL